MIPGRVLRSVGGLLGGVIRQLVEIGDVWISAGDQGPCLLYLLSVEDQVDIGERFEVHLELVGLADVEA